MTKVATNRIRQMIVTAFWGWPGSDQVGARPSSAFGDVSRELGLVAHLGGGAVVARQALTYGWDR